MPADEASRVLFFVLPPAGKGCNRRMNTYLPCPIVLLRAQQLFSLCVSHYILDAQKCNSSRHVRRNFRDEKPLHRPFSWCTTLVANAHRCVPLPFLPTAVGHAKRAAATAVLPFFHCRCSFFFARKKKCPQSIAHAYPKTPSKLLINACPIGGRQQY